MSVFSIYSTVLFVVTISHVLLLRWCSLDYIYDDIRTMWSGSGFSIIISIILWLVFSVIAFFISKPHDEIFKKVQKENRIATEEEKSKCMSCYKKLIVLTIIANFLGFFVGQIVVIYQGISSGRNEYILSRVILIMAQAMGFGGVSAITTIKIMDYLLLSKQEKLRVHSIHQKRRQRTMNISMSITLVFGIVLYFALINMLCVPYGIFYHLQRGEFSGDFMASFFNKCANCFMIDIILSLFPFLSVIRGLSTRIKKTSKALSDITDDGDLSSQINITMTDDFGFLTSTMNTLIRKLSSMIVEFKNQTQTVDRSAADISSSSKSASQALEQMSSLLSDINKNTQNQSSLIYQADKSIMTLSENVNNVKHHVGQQAETMQDISNAIDKMAGSIKEVNSIADKAHTVSETLSEKTNTGYASIKEAVESMQKIQQASEEVQQLSQVIEEVSSRTNLLAMNAAIEAAHAGEAGKGFAVVAGEVRHLATNTSQSARNVQSKIQEMLEKINHGVQAINSAGDAFNDINSDVYVNADLVKNISLAMREQSTDANLTQHNASEIVSAVKAIQNLAEEESEQAAGLRNFMKTVIDATKTTEQAVAEGSRATQNLQLTMNNVDNSVEDNRRVVEKITTYVQEFKTSIE